MCYEIQFGMMPMVYRWMNRQRKGGETTSSSEPASQYNKWEARGGKKKDVHQVIKIRKRSKGRVWLERKASIMIQYSIIILRDRAVKGEVGSKIHIQSP